MILRVLAVAAAWTALGAARDFSDSRDFSLAPDGMGPLAANVEVRRKGRDTTVRLTVRNGWRRPLHLMLCVNPEGSSSCGLSFLTASSLAPGDTVSWSAVRPAAKLKAGPMYPVVVRAVPDAFWDVRRVFVELLDGEDAAMARERVMAALANAPRFILVENRESADAIVRGRASLVERGSSRTEMKQAEARQSGVVAGVVGGAGGLAGPVPIIGEAGVAGGHLKQKSDSASVLKEEPLLLEELVIRLVLPNGQALWGWDDTKPCAERKAKCAIADLQRAATSPW